MFTSLITTIAVCAILQSIINIIAPESHMKNTILSVSNVIFMSVIFVQIFDLIKQLFVK